MNALPLYGKKIGYTLLKIAQESKEDGNVIMVIQPDCNPNCMLESKTKVPMSKDMIVARSVT